MANGKVLALVMAGGAGGRLEVLTQVRSKPVTPYAGVYRLIDFPLSNCVHSGVADVWVLEQYQPHSLNDHLANGRPWDLDRTYGGLRVLPPFQGASGSGWVEGNADALLRNAHLIREFAPELLLVLSADHVYKLDYREPIARHREAGAEVTLVTTRVPREEASREGVVEVDAEGRVTGFEYKPEEPKTEIVTTEVFVYDAAVLLETLEQLAGEVGGGTDGEEGGSLEDFGDLLLPRLVERGRAYEYRLRGYWKDVGTVESYWGAHMDLLVREPPLTLDDPGWPILTLGAQRPPARISETARVIDSLISPGCAVRGAVERSVLAPGVVIEEGAVVRDSVLLHGTRVEPGAVVEYAILDKDVHVGGDVRVGERPDREDGRRPTSEQLTLAGRGARIGRGTRVSAGARVDPSDTEEET